MNLDKAIELLERGGLKVEPDGQYPDSQWFRIIGGYTGECIGYTSDRLSVLEEEPDATFEPVSAEQYLKEMKELEAEELK